MSERKPGLPSIHQARDDRARGKYSRTSGNMWLAAAGAIIAALIGYRFLSGRELDLAKGALLAKQRAVAGALGPKWFPLRDRIEKLTLDAAAHFDGDHVDPALQGWDYRSKPGLYLRLRVAEAKDTETLRHAATNSAKDAFVGCFLREPNTAAAKGQADAGAFAEQPWNWRHAYEATRILTDDWVAQVKDAGDPIRLRIFEQQYEKAAAEEIPLAVDIVARADFFLLVLDEDDAAARAEGGAPPTEEALQEVPHFARVHLLDLRSGGKELLRLRRNAEASFVFAGEQPVSDPETLSAMKRQVNNCALAKAVDAAARSVPLDR